MPIVFFFPLLLLQGPRVHEAVCNAKECQDPCFCRRSTPSEGNRQRGCCGVTHTASESTKGGNWILQAGRRAGMRPLLHERSGRWVVIYATGTKRKTPRDSRIQEKGNRSAKTLAATSTRTATSGKDSARPPRRKRPVKMFLIVYSPLSAPQGNHRTETLRCAYPKSYPITRRCYLFYWFPLLFVSCPFPFSFLLRRLKAPRCSR